MATTQLGTAINFGFTGTDGIAASQFTGKIFLQSVDYSEESDEEQVRDSIGDIVNRSFYNLSKKATIQYIPRAETGTNTLADAQTHTSLPAVGTVIQITACASLPSLVNTTDRWIVVAGGKITGSNTGAAKISLPVENHANITAAIS